MKKLTSILLVTVAMMSLSSCYSHRVDVAGYTRDFGEEKMYDRAKQFYLFEGLIPLGRATLKTPSDGVCQIRTYYSPIDAFVTIITGGLFSMRTVKCYHIQPGTDIREIYHVGEKVQIYDKKQKRNVDATITAISDKNNIKVRLASGEVRKIDVKQIGGRGE